MGAVHLGVVKLEENGQMIPEAFLPVFAPDQKGIVENAAVHTDGTINLGIHNGGGTDDHTGFRQIPVLTGFCYLDGLGQVFEVEGIQILGEGEIAGTDFAGFVLYDGIYCDGIILNQFVTNRQNIEFFDPGSGFSDAEGKEHIEFQMISAADPDQIGHIHGFEKGNHGIGRLHPEFKSHGSGGILGINFSGHGSSVLKYFLCPYVQTCSAVFVQRIQKRKNQSKSVQKNEAYAPQLHK